MAEDNPATDLGVLETLLDAMPIQVAVLDPFGRVLYWSTELENLFGYTADDISTESQWWPLAYPDKQYREEVQRAWHKEIERAARGGKKMELQEWIVTCKDGSKKHIEFSAALVGEYFLVMFKDITERRRIEMELRSANESLEAVIDFSPLAIITLTPDGTVTQWNPAAEAMFGWSEEEAVGLFLPIVSDEKREEHNAMRRKVLSGEGFVNLEVQRTKKDGSPIDISISTVPLKDASGNVTGIINISADVTERRRAERLLRFTQYAVDNTADAAFWMTSDAHITYVNEAACNELGYTKEELLQMTVLDIDPTFTPAMWEANWLDLRERKKQTLQTTHMAKDGHIIPVEITANLVEFEGREYDCAFARDITERKRAEHELMKSEEMLRQSQRVAQLGRYDLDITSNTWISSEIMDNIFGIEADYNKTVEGWLDLIHPEDRDEMLTYLDEQVLTGKNRFDKEYRIVRPNDGAIRWVHGMGEIEVSAAGKTPRLFGTIQDVTERKLTEEAFRFTQYVMDNIPDLAMWISPDAHFLYVNKATTELLGYTKEEMLDMTVADVNPYFPMEVWAEHWQELRKKNGMTFESVQIAKDGQVHPVEITAKIVEFEGMEYKCAFIRDITERKRAERDLKLREEEDIRRKQEAETAAKQFLRNTIFAVTDGRLSLVSYKEADQLCLENCYLVEVNDAETLGNVRETVADTALELGMPEDRVHALVTAVGEATVNALKHAGGGIITIHDLGDRIRVGIRDRGEGIESLILPTATLMTRFSTKRSMGFGYAIMLSSVDAVYLATGKQGTSIILEQWVRSVSSEISLVQLPDVW